MELIRHETCQQYFYRRLSEGWKCISLEGYYAVLLSPEGIRREIDLRNGVETLRPNGVGYETLIPNQAPPSGQHWEKVDEVTPDNSNTMVLDSSIRDGAFRRDLYALTTPSGSGNINSVKVYMYVTGIGVALRHYKTAIRTHSVIYNGTEYTPTHTDWGEGSLSFTTYNNNPNTGLKWTWDELDALEAGLSLAGDGSTPHCSQVYVEDDYTAVGGLRSHGYIIG